MAICYANNHWTNSPYTHLIYQNHNCAHTHSLFSLPMYACLHIRPHSQRLCVAYVPHSVGGANSLPGVNKLTVSAPVPHSTPLGKSHPLTQSHPTALCCKARCAYGSQHRSVHICHLLAATVYTAHGPGNERNRREI